jgi:gamma-butyrobetaine dioxygenase
LNVWLRDNCRCSSCYHAVAEERILESAAIDLDIQAASIDLNTKAETVEVEWATEDSHASSYTFAFLAKYARKPTVSSKYEETLWSVADMERNLPTLPRLPFSRVMESEEGVLEWLELLNKYGFTVLGDVPHGRKRVEQVGRRISVIRNSFWGESSWDVKDQPDPTSLSLTGGALFPHTDLCFSDSQPGVQFLHCLEFSADKLEGGESTIVDGYFVAEKIRREDPAAFRTLTTVDVAHVFSSDKHFFRFDGPVISLHPDGRVREMRYNQALIAPLEAVVASGEETGKALEAARELYRALRVFATETRSLDNLLHWRLRQGELLVFNNRRMLHGRSGYNAVNTRRHLEGCYLDYEEFTGRLKKLREKFAQ